MTTPYHFARALILCAFGSVTAGGAMAQASWDLDACSSGTKSASGYSNCGGNAAANGVTVDIKAYSSTGSTSKFTTASTSINNGGSYLGVWSGNENSVGGTTADSASPHHAIDNFTGYGNAYELVHLDFSAAVDLSSVAANWVYSSSAGYGDFQVYRWDVNAGTPDPTITNFKHTDMTGWSLVASKDFSSGLTKSIDDGTYFSSHWLITTKFGGNNDAFKLGSVSAMNVCTGPNTVGSTGTTCVPPQTPGLPEPASLALFAVAALGAGAARRRALSKKA